MKKALLTISIIAILLAVGIFLKPHEKTTEEWYRVAAQNYLRFSQGEGRVIAKYGDIAVTKAEIAYEEAMEHITGSAEQTRQERILTVARKKYMFAQSKILGLYPTEEDIVWFHDLEKEGFDKNPEENAEYLEMTGLTREQAIEYMVYIRIESMVLTDYRMYIKEMLTEADPTGNEIMDVMVEQMRVWTDPENHGDFEMEEYINLLYTLVDYYVDQQIGA